MRNIRTALLKMATEDPSIRQALVPLTREAAKWESKPKGWTDDSRKKFWETLTGDNKHKVTKCIKEMSKGDKGIDDPGAFCASLADRVMGKGWRSEKKASTDKEAFNKFNVPEVMSALIKALAAAGLNDTVTELKSKGFTRLVNDAWNSRDKT